ncbi:EAL domain-containing protein [Pseudomonas protegens]|uniref:EAL domain-containing response regulator n=1 Tax=Pseudomonas protegens TaxID=380021 RepID=UPI003821A48E
MRPDCVLVVERHPFQRGVLAKALTNQQVGSVLSVDSVAQAVAHLHRHEAIDILFFDVSDSSIDSHEFLRVACELGNVRALVMYSELHAELYRSVAQLKSFFGIRVLGVLDKPLQLQCLQKMLAHFIQLQHYLPDRPTPENELIPQEQVRYGLATGAFQAWYQPKFNLRDGLLFGAEVLVRWHHPSRGLLLPRDLLAAVLAYDLIDEMFKQLLDQGLSLLARLYKQDIELGLAFNLTASQLVRNELVDHIVQRLREHGLSGSSLMFEVSENSLLDLPDSARKNFERLHQSGCGLSIDDFGVGFSSLQLLTHLPFDQLKLDSMFVQNLNEPDNRAIVAGSLALARTLRMDLVIEGVANQEILDTLTSLGCTFGQGFHLALPMTGSDFVLWLEQYALKQHLSSTNKA